MSLLRKFNTWISPPEAASTVEGFTIAIETKREPFFRPVSKNPGRRQNDRGYYEVTVQATGENPEYPAGEAVVLKFTHALEGSYLLRDNETNRTDGNRTSIAHDSLYTRFEVVEELSQPGPVLWGKPLPQHHAVKVKAAFTDAAAQSHACALTTDDWVRKSEREAPEWQAAQKAPLVMNGAVPPIEETLATLHASPLQRIIKGATVLKDRLTVKKPLSFRKQP